MNVNFIIVQEIEKRHGVKEAFFEPNYQLLPTDSLAIRLTENLNNRYNNRNINRAIFRNDILRNFSSKFDEFNSERTAEKFKEFSIHAITDLRQELEEVTFASGGYFVFIDYSVQSNINYTACFLVRNTDGLIFERDETTGEFKICEQFHIDFEKMAVGCRISLESYNSEEEIKYLNFITSKNEPVSEYFRGWINAHEFEDEKADSNSFINLIEVLPLPIFNDEEITRDEFKRKVHDLILASPNRRAVNLSHINNVFYGDNNIIMAYVENNQIPISTSFNARPEIIKKLVKFNAFVDKIQLSFPTELFDSEVVRANIDEDLVIIKSKALAQLVHQAEQS